MDGCNQKLSAIHRHRPKGIKLLISPEQIRPSNSAPGSRCSRCRSDPRRISRRSSPLDPARAARTGPGRPQPSPVPLDLPRIRAAHQAAAAAAAGQIRAGSHRNPLRWIPPGRPGRAQGGRSCLPSPWISPGSPQRTRQPLQTVPVRSRPDLPEILPAGSRQGGQDGPRAAAAASRPPGSPQDPRKRKETQ